MLNGGYRPLAVHSPWSRACAVEVAGKAPMGRDWQKGQPRWRLFGDHPECSRAGANTGLLLGVSDLTGASKTTIWRWAKDDPTFPKPFHLSAAVTCWDEGEILAWITSKKAPRRIA